MAIVTLLTFNGSLDFNPYVGEDRKTSLNGGNDVYVTRYDASGAYAWTQTFGGTSNDFTYAVTVANGKVYVGGETGSTDAGFGGQLGTISTFGNTDAFVLVLYANTGAPVTAFGGDGVQHVGGTQRDITRSLLASGNTLYVCGDFESTNMGVGANGAAACVGVTNGFVAALHATTGAALTSFDGDGIVEFGGAANDFGRALALQARSSSAEISKA